MKLGKIFAQAGSILRLMVLILFFWLEWALRKASRWIKPAAALAHKVNTLASRLDPATSEPSISRTDLIRLAVKNMKQKKTRTMVTIGGMTIGIGTIVFLLAIGFGLQNLVVNRVARLEEMRQTDVTIPPGSNLIINEETLREFARIGDVESVSPVIALVAKASYQNSSTDLVAYGVTRDYLEQSAIKPIKGEMFTHNQITLTEPSVQQPSEPVADAQPTSAQQVEVEIIDSEWVELRDQPDLHAQLLGYTRDNGATLTATVINGEEYMLNQQLSNNWYEIRVPVWDDVEGDYQPKLNDAGDQVMATGYLPQTSVVIEGAEVVSDAEETSFVQTRNVDLPQDVSNQVVVNRAALKVLGLDEESALGQKFDLSFVVTGELLSNKNEKLQSNPITYEIIGITPDENSPVIYVPFIDLRMLEIDQFSQVKVSVIHETRLEKAREHIENLGFNTRSVSDTVSQINSLFSTARTMLALLGAVALSIASLGMFNTLTVSLLERTREVGLMKAMGLKNSEVKELFLTESMIMGSMGGFLGLTSGFLAAKLVEAIISAYTLMRGVGLVSIVSVPILFALLIIFISFMVGLLTGIYPARRSTRISALNALRYE